MSEEEVVALMKSSRSDDEWNANAARVKAAYGGRYPAFWFPAIMLSGVAEETAQTWGGTAALRILVDPESAT